MKRLHLGGYQEGTEVRDPNQALKALLTLPGVGNKGRRKKKLNFLTTYSPLTDKSLRQAEQHCSRSSAASMMTLC